jgi:hypothetical protein
MICHTSVVQRSEGVKINIQESTCMPMLIAATVTIAKLWIQPRWPTTDEQTEKIWDIYTIESQISQVFGHVCNLGLLS